MQPTDVTRWTAWPASREVFSLGEGPVWDPARERLLWVDVDAGTVHEGGFASGGTEIGGTEIAGGGAEVAGGGAEIVRIRSRHLDRTVGAVVCSAEGDLFVAGEHTLVALTGRGEPRAEMTTPILPPGSPRRLNDGACDPSGAFLVGSMALDGSKNRDVLVRVERDGTVTTLDDDLTLSNGLAWTADGATLYSVDSVPGTVWTRPYDPVTGATGPRREWLSVTDALPDGLCVDAEDHVWIAMWGLGEVRRYTPDGTLAGVVEVPAPHTTSMAFIGDLMLITTATFGLTPEQLAAYPDSGRLFLARTGVTGLPATPWKPLSGSESSCA